MAAKKKAKKAARPAKGVVAAKDEPLEEKTRRARKILARLKKMYPGATTALNHSNALELLVATMLSAQCTDERVNEVTRSLFAEYKTAEDYAKAPLRDLEQRVRPTGFFRQKAKNIQAACRVIAERFGGKVPANMDDLLELPGVARKTANVVLSTVFGKNEGICVDTHVGRVACRLGLTWTAKDTKDAAKIEQDLMRLLPRKDWGLFSHATIWHGRRVCTARKPDCEHCRLAPLCPSAFAF